jgi:membrane associated rhomboid family serine protease
MPTDLRSMLREQAFMLGLIVFMGIIFAAQVMYGAEAYWPYMITFVVTAICGSVFRIVMNAGSSIPMLGASGAVMGFEGLYLGMAVRWHLPDPEIWPMDRPIPPTQLAVLGIMGLTMDYMGFLGGNLGVAYSAHLGGFVGGIVLGSVVVPMPRLAYRR